MQTEHFATYWVCGLNLVMPPARIQLDYTMPAKRTVSERARDIALTAKYYLQGHSMRSIADKLNSRAGVTYTITYKSVHNDIMASQDLWLASAIIDLDAFKAQQVAKLDLVEKEAWDAWEKSKANRIRTTKNLEEGREYTAKDINQPDQVVTENSAGDIRFLNLAMDCVMKRNELMGLKTLNINLNKTEESTNSDDPAHQVYDRIRKGIINMDKESLFRLVHGPDGEGGYIDFEELEIDGTEEIENS